VPRWACAATRPCCAARWAAPAPSRRPAAAAAAARQTPARRGGRAWRPAAGRNAEGTSHESITAQARFKQGCTAATGAALAGQSRGGVGAQQLQHSSQRGSLAGAAQAATTGRAGGPRRRSPPVRRAAPPAAPAVCPGSGWGRHGRRPARKDPEAGRCCFCRGRNKERADNQGKEGEGRRKEGRTGVKGEGTGREQCRSPKPSRANAQQSRLGVARWRAAGARLMRGLAGAARCSCGAPAAGLGATAGGRPRRGTRL
jgi:hypothetical protein